MKKCASCELEKEETLFHRKKGTRDGLHNYCKECTAQKNKEWVVNNKERHKASCSSWYKNNKDKAKQRSTEWHYMTYYGISYSDFRSLAQDQDNKCKLCGIELSFSNHKKQNGAVLDHCHTTGKIRGVLCSGCNKGLGHFKDNIELFNKAILYLKG